MSGEIQQNFLLENLNKITRSYNSKAEGNNPVTNTIFSWFDTDGNGVFSDEEWAKKEKYVQELQTKLNIGNDEEAEGESGVVKFYHNRVKKVAEKIQKLNIKTHKIYEKENYFLQLCDFEDAHNIERSGYLKKSEIPEGAVTVDISMFDMGILDEKEEYFTDETYKKGYIKFPEDISEEDKKAYLELLKKAQKQSRQVQKCMQKWEQLDKEYNTAREYYDIAKSGKIDRVGSQEYEMQMYQQYQSLRDASNPYYKQYKEIEAKYNTLRLKVHRTADEENQLRQYNQILCQLEAASKAWSLSDMQDPNKKFVSDGGLSITNIDETVSYNADSSSKELNDEHSVGLRYSNANWELTARGSETDRYTYEPERKTEHEGNFNFDCTYKRGKWGISSGVMFYGNQSMTKWTPSLGFRYGDFNFKTSEDITTVKQEMPDASGNMVTTPKTTKALNFEFGWQKMSENGASGSITSNVRIAENEGTYYTVGAGIQYPMLRQQLSKHNLSWSLGGNLTGEYDDETHRTTVNPSVSTTLAYNNRDFNAQVTLDENFSNTVQRGSKPEQNQTFTASGRIGYKRVSLLSRFSDTDNAYSHTKTYSTQVAWAPKKAGTVSVEYRYMDAKSKGCGGNSSGHFVSLNYSAPMDLINNLFKSKDKKRK